MSDPTTLGNTRPLPIHPPGTTCVVATAPLLDGLPSIWRIQSLVRALQGSGILNRAVVAHRRGSLCVDWISQQVDSRLHVGGLVTLRRASITRSHDGAVRIQCLLPEDRPLATVNLFDTLLPGWVKDADLVARASVLWAGLPRPLAHLVNAVLWPGDRLHRFVTGPSSIQGHHNSVGGNFRHSMDVAETAIAFAQTKTGVSRPLLAVGGLLHDLGKAAEYRYNRELRRFYLSDRGELIGHRDTLIEWLSVAREGVLISDAVWLALLHMLNASRGAPEWMGLRIPRTLEAEILSHADRLSGHYDLYSQCLPDTPSGKVPDGGGGRFGHFHRHLGVRPYRLTADLSRGEGV